MFFQIYNPQNIFDRFFFMTTNQEGTDTQTHGHRDSMIESAQWADSMKTKLSVSYLTDPV